jgi:hypothetical protein
MSERRQRAVPAGVARVQTKCNPPRPKEAQTHRRRLPPILLHERKSTTTPERAGTPPCSLDKGVTSYDPEEVTFVFARDLSKPQRDRFKERLVNRHPSVKVKYWGLHRIQELLARHPDIATRYLGEDRTDALPGLIRGSSKAARNSRTPVTSPTAPSPSMPSRTSQIRATSTTSRSGGLTSRNLCGRNPPFMVIEQIRADRRVTTEVRLRPEAQADAFCGFTNDAAGERARERVREGFAAGQSVERRARDGDERHVAVVEVDEVDRPVVKGRKDVAVEVDHRRSL